MVEGLRVWVFRDLGFCRSLESGFENCRELCCRQWFIALREMDDLKGSSNDGGEASTH